MNFSALRLFRVSTTILRASSKSNKPYFNPAGHLNADHFVVLDENVKREVYMNRNYGKKGEEVQVIVEKALAQDEQAITNFYVSHFGVNEPINATLSKLLLLYIPILLMVGCLLIDYREKKIICLLFFEKFKF